jgi:hypothetical protein
MDIFDLHTQTHSPNQIFHWSALSKQDGVFAAVTKLGDEYIMETLQMLARMGYHIAGRDAHLKRNKKCIVKRCI